MSEIGTFMLFGSVNEFVKGVGGKDALCCKVCAGAKPARLAVEEVGVSPGTASKNSGLEGEGEL